MFIFFSAALNRLIDDFRLFLSQYGFYGRVVGDGVVRHFSELIFFLVFFELTFIIKDIVVAVQIIKFEREEGEPL